MTDGTSTISVLVLLFRKSQFSVSYWVWFRFNLKLFLGENAD